jgi:hypothetical protein
VPDKLEQHFSPDPGAGDWRQSSVATHSGLVFGFKSARRFEVLVNGLRIVNQGLELDPRRMTEIRFCLP